MLVANGGLTVSMAPKHPKADPAGQAHRDPPKLLVEVCRWTSLPST
jgi:hypothetical protein